MSCVESGGQKSAPEIFAGAEQNSPPTKVSKQRDDKRLFSAEGRCQRAAQFSSCWGAQTSSTGPNIPRPQAQWRQEEEKNRLSGHNKEEQGGVTLKPSALSPPNSGVSLQAEYFTVILQPVGIFLISTSWELIYKPQTKPELQGNTSPASIIASSSMLQLKP